MAYHRTVTRYCPDCGEPIKTKASGELVRCPEHRKAARVASRQRWYMRQRVADHPVGYTVVSCPDEEYPTGAWFSREEYSHMINHGCWTPGIILEFDGKHWSVEGDECSRQHKREIEG